MKILHIDTEKGFRGGEGQVLLLMEGLKKRGHENFLAAPRDSSIIEKAEDIADSILRLKHERIFSIINMHRICKFVQSSQADILHLHTAHAHMVGGIVGMLRRKPVVVTRRVDFPIRNRFKYNCLSDKIIAISQKIKEVLVRGGVIENKIAVIPSGIDTKKFDGVDEAGSLYEEFKIPQGSLVIGTVAHLADHKGHAYLLKAIPQVLKELPNCFFLFIGEGELKGFLKARCRKLGINDKVFFTGFREDIPEILSILDLFVLPSHLEGLCTSLMDAMYMGVPVVATNAGGIPEVVEDGKSGILVPPKDPRALAEAIINLLKDEDKRRRFSADGKQRIIEKFTASQMVDKVEQVYLSLLNS
jgi:glycosyltransferase involved in cell wall biosynthesis